MVCAETARSRARHGSYQMTETTRRVHVTREGEIVVQRVGIPRPAAGEALLELESAGICGSDLHAVRGRHPFLALPFNPGHEVVGRVRQTRSGLVGEGSRVVIEPTLPCGRCKMCRTGRENICPYRGFFGSNQPQGGMADFMTVRADRLHVVSPDLPAGGRGDDRAARHPGPRHTAGGRGRGEDGRGARCGINRPRDVDRGSRGRSRSHRRHRCR
ncbi:hypothetical protein CFP66_33545 [Pseudonocardia sp. MH-G8]|nr:hypothetical protein CFP66_33545 [Pseudonocardia sp. MH-G8]